MTETRRSLARRAGTVAAGTAVTGIGVALLVLPGPGLVTIAVGLNILGREIPAANRLVGRVRRRVGARSTVRSDPPS